MQGEDWSPTGEARELIATKDVRHTSMSVGDIVINHDTRVAYILDRTGSGSLGTWRPRRPDRQSEKTVPTM